MKIEIISIGEELLLGTTVDTNSSYLGRRLMEIGGKVTFKTTVGDRKEEIQEALERALTRADVILTTGGLGPTRDDVTKKVVSRILNLPLILHDRILKRVSEHFEKRGLKMPAINTSQALIPRSAIPLDNPLGTAPGLWIQKVSKTGLDEKDLILLPGVPVEMKSVFEGLLPKLREKMSGEVLLHSTLHTWGAPESEIAQRLSTFLKGKENGQVAFLPRHTGVDLRIEMKGKTEREARHILGGLEKKISDSLGVWVWGKNEETLEGVIGYLLTMRNLTLAVAESCTGGLIMDRLTGVPGSSDYFRGGIVAYSNDLKIQILKVPNQTLRKYGAVSKKTAIAMAEGIRKMAGVDLGLSVTGIAGPSGESEQKPVGLVYLGLAGGGKSLWEEHRFLGDRRMIKEQSAQGALDFLRRYLLENG